MIRWRRVLGVSVCGALLLRMRAVRTGSWVVLRSAQERADSAAKAGGMWERGHAGYAQPGGGVHIDTLRVRSVQGCEPNARVVAAEHRLAEQAQRP